MALVFHLLVVATLLTAEGTAEITQTTPNVSGKAQPRIMEEFLHQVLLRNHCQEKKNQDKRASRRSWQAHIPELNR